MQKCDSEGTLCGEFQRLLTAVLRESRPIAHKSALLGAGGEVPHISNRQHPHQVKYLFSYTEMRESKNNQHEPRNDLSVRHVRGVFCLSGTVLSARHRKRVKLILCSLRSHNLEKRFRMRRHLQTGITHYINIPWHTWVFQVLRVKSRERYYRAGDFSSSAHTENQSCLGRSMERDAFQRELVVEWHSVWQHRVSAGHGVCKCCSILLEPIVCIHLESLTYVP